jgi:integration host factor subunit alpha
MTKADIVQALYSQVGGFSKKEAAEMVDLVFELMKETLGRGEKIKISGFGNFVLRDKRQRPGRNPQTGEPIAISERRVLTFKASQILKQILNARTTGPSLSSSASSSASSSSPSAGARTATTTASTWGSVPTMPAGTTGTSETPGSGSVSAGKPGDSSGGVFDVVADPPGVSSKVPPLFPNGKPDSGSTG